MIKIFAAMALVASFATTVGAETITGGNASNCSDKNAFYHPIVDGVEQSYWNNASCKSGNGGKPFTITDQERITGTDLDGDDYIADTYVGIITP